MTTLYNLVLWNNAISGPIPTQISSLTGLSILDLDDNRLTGTIPTQLGALTSLTELYLYSRSDPGLTGTIPSQLGFLTELTHLWIRKNPGISGTIPSELGSLSNLTNLQLQNNALTGTIPATLDISNFDVFDISGNQICGDDVVNDAEACDGTNLAGQTCVSQGFDSGTLACDADCAAFDTSGCDSCGTGVKAGTEVCDGTDLGGETCVSQGFTTGTLACASDCTAFDTSNCFGESTTLAEAQAAAGAAKTTLDAYFTARSAKLVADHNLAVAVAACEDATEAATEAAALETETTNAYNQAVLQEAALEDVYDAAVTASQATDATPADKTWKLLNAKAAWDQAVAEREAADTAKSAADSASGTAEGTKTTACDYATLSTAATAADSAYTTAETNVEDDDNIPTINPTTLDFIYEDLDGDLIPNQFDACPTQMGLRRNSPTIPGPQDFCPSGCPELWDTVNDQAVDSDGDGIPDCEDRCPFEGSDGINYSHADHLTTVSGFSLAWNGCKDSDGDGIPDKFDACPSQAGGACTSGCPDPGNNIDSDLDGVIDCADRCPNTYAVGTADGCPDLDMDGVPDSIDYCMATPGSASFAFNRKLETDGSGNPVAKDLTIMGCPDADADLVPDAVDLCDAPSYPNQGDEVGGVKTSGVAVVDKRGCPLDSDNDSVFDGYDKCDATVHSDNSAHDPNAIVYTEEDGVDASLLGCPKDTDNDGVVDGIDQVRKSVDVVVVSLMHSKLNAHLTSLIFLSFLPYPSAFSVPERGWLHRLNGLSQGFRQRWRQRLCFYELHHGLPFHYCRAH